MSHYNIDLVGAIKNNFYSKISVYSLRFITIAFMVMVTISSFFFVSTYFDLKSNTIAIKEYEELSELYTSYGRSYDKAEELRNKNEVISYADNVKKMYIDNMDCAYVMEESISELANMGPNSGIDVERAKSSYQWNYVVINENYIRDYTDLSLSNMESTDNNETIVFVPEVYKDQEDEIYSYYEETVNNLYNRNQNYGAEKETINSVTVKYIPSGYELSLLSSYQYADDVDINLSNPIIIVDRGQFASGYYFDVFSQCQLAFKTASSNEFYNMLVEYGIDDLYFSHDMSEPFQIKISNSRFLLVQTFVFLMCFALITIFVLYVSNYVNIMFKRKEYSVKTLLGERKTVIICRKIIGNILLLLISIIVIVFYQNPVLLCLLIIDGLLYILLYNRLIDKRVKDILNGDG